jgi:hypothetical protein
MQKRQKQGGVGRSEVVWLMAAILLFSNGTGSVFGGVPE